jgi:hypothetical protein
VLISYLPVLINVAGMEWSFMQETGKQVYYIRRRVFHIQLATGRREEGANVRSKTSFLPVAAATMVTGFRQRLTSQLAIISIDIAEQLHCT